MSLRLRVAAALSATVALGTIASAQTARPRPAQPAGAAGITKKQAAAAGDAGGAAALGHVTAAASDSDAMAPSAAGEGGAPDDSGSGDSGSPPDDASAPDAGDAGGGGSDGGGADAAAALPTDDQLQDAAYIAQHRADLKQAVASADADVKTAQTALGTLKVLQADMDAAKGDALALSGLKKQLWHLDPEAANVDDAIARAAATIKAKRDALDAAKKDLDAFEARVKEPSRDFFSRLQFARAARCQTAYCFGPDGDNYAFEPMLELPIGTSFALGDRSGLAKFDSGATFSIQFSAGLRFWFFRDLCSLSVYFAQPVYSGDSKVHIAGSGFDYPTSSIRRLGPSFAFGFAGDMLFIGGGIDELRNGSATNSPSTDPQYVPGQVLSRAITLTVGIAPFAAIRNVASGAKGK